MKKLVLLLFAFAPFVVLEAQNDTTPYSEGFESWGNGFDTSWSRFTIEEFYGDIYGTHSVGSVASSSAAHTGYRSLRMASAYSEENYDMQKFTTYAFMPTFDHPVQALRLRFWYKLASGVGQVTLGVGVSEGVSDQETFTRLVSISAADTGWHQYEVDLGPYDGHGTRIGFCQRYNDYNEGTYYGYIDDIVVEPLGDCIPPISLHVDELTGSSVTLSWYDLYHSGTYKVVVNGDESAYQYTHDTVITLYLEPDTDYTVAVSTLCDSVYTEPRTIVLHTPCLAVAHSELPWMENFDAAASVSNGPLKVGCMEFHRRQTINRIYPYASNLTYYGVSGKSLFFQPSYGEHQMAVLPLFADSIHTLAFSAQVYASGRGNDLVLGTMTRPDDPTTFVPVDTLHPDTVGRWCFVEYSFANYSDTGRYIAIRPETYSGYESLYIDDIIVSEFTNCQHVRGVSVSGLSSTEVTLDIDDDNEEGSYRVWLTSPTDSAEHRQEFSTSSVTFSDLQPNTSYMAYAVALCDSVVARPVTIAFTTPCIFQPMPWGEDFDSLGVTTFFSISLLDSNCWDFFSGNSGRIDSVVAGAEPFPEDFAGQININSTIGPFANPHLALNIWGSNTFLWAVTPAILIEGQAVLSFDLALTRHGSGALPPAGNIADDRFVVAATRDGGLSWDILAQWGSDTADRDDYFYGTISAMGQPVSIPIDSYDGETVRIAFYGESTVGGGDNYIHIDNLTVGENTCLSPQGMHIGSITQNAATVSWQGNGEGYEYQWALASDTSLWVTDTITGTSFSLSGLSASVSYICRVRTLCGSTTSPWSVNTFHTECGTILHEVLPFEEDFDNYSTNSSSSSMINFPPCWSRLGYHLDSVDTNSLFVNTFPYVVNTQYHGNTGNSFCFEDPYYMMTELMVLPAFDTLRDLYVGFWAYKTLMFRTLEVGVMTDPDSLGSFTVIKTMTPEEINRWEQFHVLFNEYNGPGKYIAFRTSQLNGGKCYIDDIIVDVVTTCVDTVRMLEVSHQTDVSLDIDFIPGFGLYDSVVVVIEDTFGTVLQTIVDSLSPTPVSGLTASTPYRAVLSVYCDGAVTATASLPFATTCDRGKRFEITADSLGLEPGTDRFYPISTYYRYSVSEQIFRAEEIGFDGGDISAVAFNYIHREPTTIYDSVILYLGHTSDTLLTEWVPLESLTRVYTGPLNMSKGWNEFVFETPFEFNGSDNVILACEAPIGRFLNSDKRFAVHAVPKGASRSFSSDYQPFSGRQNTRLGSVRNDVRFVICYIGHCPAPNRLTVSVETENSLVVSWTENGSATAWIVECNGQSTNATTTTCTLTGIEADSIYTVRVKAVCDGGEESAWSQPVVVRTSNNGIPYVDNREIYLYPNPANSTVTLSGTDVITTVTVVDISGRKIAEYKMQDPLFSLDIKGWPAGTYFLRITTPLGTTTKKLLVR